MQTCLAALFFILVVNGGFAQEAAPRDVVVELSPKVPSPSPSPPATPAPTASPLRMMLEATLRRDSQPETVFRSDIPNLFLRWRGENLPLGAVVRLLWIAEDVGKIVDPNFVIDQDETRVETSTFTEVVTLSRPADGWAVGKYRVDLYVDDELKDTLGITIRD